ADDHGRIEREGTEPEAAHAEGVEGGTERQNDPRAHRPGGAGPPPRGDCRGACRGTRGHRGLDGSEPGEGNGRGEPPGERRDSVLRNRPDGGRHCHHSSPSARRAASPTCSHPITRPASRAATLQARHARASVASRSIAAASAGTRNGHTTMPPPPRNRLIRDSPGTIAGRPAKRASATG